MSEIANTQSQSKPNRSAAGQGRVLARVEKWMEVIREISLDQAKS